MSNARPDPWATVETANGFPADQVISALQKEVRRGNTENAALLAHEMIVTGTDLEDYLWRRLMVISVEDVGFGAPDAPILINALYQMVTLLGPAARDRELFAVHAVRYLAQCTKDRSSDEMTLWVKRAFESGDARPVIPDYALDMHTSAGKTLGRGLRHFMETGSQVRPERADRDLTYRDRIMETLGDEEPKGGGRTGNQA